MPQFPFARRVLSFLAFPLLFGICAVLNAQDPPSSASAPPAPSTNATAPPAQQDSPKHDTAKSTNAQQPSDNSELVTQDSAATFKVRVNLVLVRVVVRDNQGKVVTNLRREDFQLFDNRKPQAITYFSAETPESQALRPAATITANEESAVTPEETQAAVKKLPQRFVGVMFDDVHMSMEDTAVVRDAATRLFGALAPSDRVAMFSASGQFHLQFTADHDQLAKSLYSLVPRPTTGAGGLRECPEVTYYQADLIQNKSDSQALAIAAEDAVQCAFNGDETKIAQATQMAQSAAMRVLNLGDGETEYAYRHIEEAIKQLSAMPGQRVMVFVSPGFIPSTLWSETSDLIDRASHAGIVINTIDARGLYTPDLLGDIANPPRGSALAAGIQRLLPPSRAGGSGRGAATIGLRHRRHFFSQSQRSGRRPARSRCRPAAFLFAGIFAAKFKSGRPLSRTEGFTHQQTEIFHSSPQRILRPQNYSQSRGSC